ncbi:MAG TPA: hypothetical protein DIS53_00140 [Candidatus Wildermuthbacteria bacterium]|nr:hypothetical protein [Candidatus Wildermuthbacteria bacterium]
MAKFKQILIIFPIIVGLVIPSFSVDPSIVSAEQPARYYYLAQWEWITEYQEPFWRAPRVDKLVGLVDLRPLSSQGKTGGEPEGYGFFAYNEKVSIPGSIYLGDNLKGEIRNKQKVAEAFDVELQSNTILDFLWGMLTVHSDPLGQMRVKPLMPNENLELELYLEGLLVKSELFDITSHPHREKVLAVLQNMYRREREFDKTQGSTHYLKVLGAWMEKYRVSDHTIFLPPDVPDESWLQPETVITDNFNTDTSANWTADNGSFTIDAGNSNIFECAGTECVARYSATALSTKDHYAQVAILTVGNSWNGPMIRKMNSSTLTYYAHLYQGNSQTTQLFKRVNGSYSQVGGNYNYTHSSGDVYKIQAAGTTITTYVNGVQAHSQTDSAIDEQFRAGIVSNNTDTDFDDFQAGDNNATPADPTSLTQLKSDDATTISNGGYTPETSVNLKASVTDADTTETLTLFFELVANADSFTSTSTPVVGESCASGTAYASCSSKVWYITSSSGNYSSTPFTATSTVATLTDATGYKWQAKACDDDSACSSWAAFNATTPNFTIDTTGPTTPGTPSTTSPSSDTTPAWTWSASTDSGAGLHATTPYWVEWSTNANFTSSVSSSTAATASFTHSSALTDETTWYFRVRALDAVNNESAYSSNASVVVDTTPPPGPGASRAGGSSAAGTVFLQQQGFLPSPEPPVPSPLAPSPPPPRIPEIFEPLIPSSLRPAPPPPEPIGEELIPQEAPLVLQGQWQLLPSQPIGEFVLAPLPSAIRELTQKFPGLDITFERVGIKKITDLPRLRTAPLFLPGLTQTAQLPKGVLLASLSPEEKEDIPCDVIFAQAGDGLIDFSIVLSIGERGEVEQKIRTIAGKPLELMLRPCAPQVASGEPGETSQVVKGYFVFKSKNPRADSLQFPSSSILASAAFAYPAFAQNQEQSVRIEEALVLFEFVYADPDGDGIYTADITAPVVNGEYEIVTVVEYEDLEAGARVMRLITVVDPEGYVYERIGNKRAWVSGASVSLFWFNSQLKQYQLWPAGEYQQENPQTTDATGRYSFLVPEGSYYLQAETPGYLPYQGEVFWVREGSPVHANIELKTRYWWLTIVDWRTAVLIGVVLLLLLNFWRDKIFRRRLLKKSQSAHEQSV